ncbi:MAG TPA: NAD-glutamate dehydrogenase domain-containing protein, partial [Gammaproteobacteria bacterium]
MSYNRQRNNAGINKILRVARKRLSEAQLTRLEPYIKHYFQNMAPDDLESLDPAAAFEIVHGHWQLAKTRARGKGLVSVINPSWEANASHTAVDIVTDNMPFLVDSVRMELNRQGFIVDLLIHPVFQVERDRQGVMKTLRAPGQPQGEVRRESFIHAEIGRVLDSGQLQTLESGLQRVLQHVRRAVTDWPTMSAKLHDIIQQLEEVVARIPPRYMDEVRAFLRWLDERNFTFLGFQEYGVVRDAQTEMLEPVKGSALGIMRDRQFSEADGEAPLFAKGGSRRSAADELLLITKSLARSTVHRPGYLDYIAVRHFDGRGRIVGESRFLGLYTSMAYRRNPHDIPIVRSKIANVFARAEFDPVSHIGKSFLHVLETYPRDELFQIAEGNLFAIAMGILHLGERQRLKLFVREDRLRRFVTCLVYVPRDIYDSDLRRKMVDILLRGFQGLDLNFNVKLAEESFARVEFFIRTDPNDFPAYNAAVIEEELKEASYSWNDELRDELLAALPEQECALLLQKFAAAFPVAYQEEFMPRTAVGDIAILQNLDAGETLKVNLYCPVAGEPSALWLKLYKRGAPIAPSDSLPVLENMGVKVVQERPYRIVTGDGVELWIHDHGLLCRCEVPGLDTLKPVFEEIFADVWYGRIENDGFNALGITAGLPSREIVVIRAYCKFLLQAGLTFSQAYMEQCLIRHAGLTRQLIGLFKLRFDPGGPSSRQAAQETLEKTFTEQLDTVSSLDEDRILRNFFGAILATVRTNYFQAGDDGKPKPYLSFKFESARLPELPEPRPLYEIFVYSPRMEGVHLRAGKVARGGIRWSDRREDFRTEVLGLVKAQKVKNAVIVPTGAKGGFYVKQPPGSGGREALMEEAVYCYRQFICGLLDITDNLRNGKPAPPPNVVRHDEDDPYLVVAADKGTATFSDYANELAEGYGYWLGDAFASGGSRGYDHKKMGITARGAWESVKLLFRDQGKNIQAEDFTAVGIGDMAGDVFGNGMLLSKHIKLLGAFNHMHIFLDPDPDPAAGFRERQRLFRLARSTWADYNPELISKGGGVYPRNAKSIPLSSEVQAMLGTKRSSMPPNE